MLSFDLQIIPDERLLWVRLEDSILNGSVRTKEEFKTQKSDVSTLRLDMERFSQDWLEQQYKDLLSPSGVALLSKGIG